MANDADKMAHDPTEAGLPVLGAPGHPALAAAPGNLPSGDLVVEVEMLSDEHARHLVRASGHEGLHVAAAAAPGEPGLDPDLGALIRRYAVQAVRPAFSDAALAHDALRRAAPPAVGQAQPAAEESLPSMHSFVRLHFPEGTPEGELLQALRSNKSIAKAVKVPGAAPPSAVLAPAEPNFDPLVGNGMLAEDPVTKLETQWYLHRLRVPQAWATTKGRGTVLVDIDWGCRVSHGELSTGVEHTHNAVDGGQDVTHGGSIDHGTAVASIAAARGNGQGIEGVAPEAMIWVIQADSGPGPAVSQNPWADALEYVARQNSNGRPRVVILEVQTFPGLGNYEQVPSVHLAVRHAMAAGCIVCVAAGNGGRPADRTDDGEAFEPTGSILVGATAFDPVHNPRAWFSNYGSSVVVCAPGDPGHDVSCTAGGDWSYRNRFGGTSGATPKVAGVAALMLAANPALNHQQVRQILIETGSEEVGDPGKPIGVLIDAEAAVLAATRHQAGTTPGTSLVSIAGGKTSKQDNATGGQPADGDTSLGQAWQLAAQAIQAVAQVMPAKEGAISVNKGSEGSELLAGRTALLACLGQAADHLIGLLPKGAANYVLTSATDLEQAYRASLLGERLRRHTHRLTAALSRAVQESRTAAAAAPMLAIPLAAQAVPLALGAIAQAVKLFRVDRSISVFEPGDECTRILCRMVEAKSVAARGPLVRRFETGADMVTHAHDLARRVEELKDAIARASAHREALSESSVAMAAGAVSLLRAEVDRARPLLAAADPDVNPTGFWDQVRGEAMWRELHRSGRIDLHLRAQAEQTVERRALRSDRVAHSGTVLLDYRITDPAGALVTAGAKLIRVEAEPA